MREIRSEVQLARARALNLYPVALRHGIAGVSGQVERSSTTRGTARDIGGAWALSGGRRRVPSTRKVTFRSWRASLSRGASGLFRLGRWALEVSTAPTGRTIQASRSRTRVASQQARCSCALYDRVAQQLRSTIASSWWRAHGLFGCMVLACQLLRDWRANGCIRHGGRFARRRRGLSDGLSLFSCWSASD